MSALLRSWRKDDLPQIARMERECFLDPWTEEMLADCLQYPYYHCFLVEEGGQVCGYCCLILLFEDGEVANIAVDKFFRGRGIAKLLMNAMHEEAKRKGATRCLLEVRESNVSARGLYESFGYASYGRRRKYYADGEDAILMEKRL